MSFLPGWPGGFAAPAGPVGVVTLTGDTVSDSDLTGGIATATLRIDFDGNVYEVTSFGTTQLFSATNWVRPVSAAPGNYEVRYTNLTGDPLFSATAAQNVWHVLSSGGDFILTQRQVGLGLKSSTFTVEIRWGSGPVLASAAYTISTVVFEDPGF